MPQLVTFSTLTRTAEGIIPRRQATIEVSDVCGLQQGDHLFVVSMDMAGGEQSPALNVTTGEPVSVAGADFAMLEQTLEALGEAIPGLLQWLRTQSPPPDRP